MPFPAGWPPDNSLASVKSGRFYQTGTGTANFSDNGYLYGRVNGNLFITNSGAALLEFSFDGTVVHGSVPAGTTRLYRDRYEAGIAVRGVTTFVIEAW